jgi:hypothetical protein
MNPQFVEILQDAKWPGIVATDSCVYTCSHGITPGRAVLVSSPQPEVVGPGADKIIPYGTLVFSDGIRGVKINRCRLDRLTADQGPRGTTYTLEILDRRWMFKPPGDNGRGRIDGAYNEKDTRGKLVPWSIRSPYELAELCLRAMGETNYSIKLPEGLPRRVGQDLNRYLRLGENFPQSLANPEMVWDVVPPGEALSRLCDVFGCRLIFQPFQDKFVVMPIGEGLRTFPVGAPYETITPTIAPAEVPVSVGVAGAPIRIQARFKLEAVGEEWDGSILPIKDLSYAPEPGEAADGKPQITRIHYVGGDTPVSLTVGVTFKKQNGAVKFKQAFDFDPAHSVAVRLATIVSGMLADPDVAAELDATSFSDVAIFTGKRNGVSFSFTAVGFASPAANNLFEVLIDQEAAGDVGAADGGWGWSDPPVFLRAKPTDRLSKEEAQSLARKSVFKYFRIRLVDPETGSPPLKLPYYGEVKRRQQIVLQGSKVDMVKPAPRIGGVLPNNGVIPDVPGNGVLPEFYNGYSRDQAPTVTGSVYANLMNVMWKIPNDNPFWDMNTKRTDRVFIDIAKIDPVEQIVVFSDHVYKWVPSAGPSGRIAAPDLTLETGCLVRSEETGEFLRWREELPLGGISPTEWSLREDVQVGIVGKYGTEIMRKRSKAEWKKLYAAGLEAAANAPPLDKIDVGFNQLTGFDYMDLPDSQARSKFYLNAMAAQYRLTVGESRRFVGIWPIEPDGAIQQVTLMVGEEGATTIASANTEHSHVIPPFPARRRQEMLTPNSAAAAANAAEREFVRKLAPRPPGAVT